MRVVRVVGRLDPSMTPAGVAQTAGGVGLAGLSVFAGDLWSRYEVMKEAAYAKAFQAGALSGKLTACLEEVAQCCVP